MSRRERGTAEARTEGLLRLSSVLAGGGSIAERLGEVCRMVTVLLDCDRSSIFLLDGDRLRPLVNHGNPDDVQPLFEASSFSARHPFFSKVLGGEGYARIEDTSRSSLLRRDVVEQARIRAIVIAPLHGPRAPAGGGMATGLITAEYNERAGTFTDAEASYLLSMARSAGIALSEQRMREQQAQQHARRVQQAIGIQALIDLGAAHASDAGPAPFLNAAVQMMVDHGFARGAAVTLAPVAEPGQTPTADIDAEGVVVTRAGQDPLGPPRHDRLISRVLLPGEGIVLHLAPTDAEPGSQQVLEVLADRIEVVLGRLETSRRLLELSRTDALTGLPNRRCLDEYLADIDHHGDEVSVMVLDLDQFKVINDSLGHHAGDQALQIVAQRLQAATTPHFLARFGGDEFHVVLRGPQAADAVERAADAVLAQLARPLPPSLGGMQISASIGMAAGAADRSAMTLMQDADAAMYVAKGSGAGRQRWADEHTRGQARRRQDLWAALRVALEEEQLDLHYQPIWTLEERCITGFEALLRWHHPDGTTWAPDQFLDVAELSLLMRDLNLWIVDQACRDAAARAEQRSTLHTSVNISPGWLDNALLEAVDDALRRHELPPESLVVELTEDEALARGSAAWDIAMGLHDFGVQISIDDFGAGYSSFQLLADLPLSELKIDRSIVSGLEQAPENEQLVDALTRIGVWRRSRVVAEGPADDNALQRLTQLGCTHAQSFHLGRPRPVDAALVLLDSTGCASDPLA